MPGFDAVVLGNQVHGTEVRPSVRRAGWIQIEGVDGWVTTAPGVLLTVTVADCIPVYLAVPGAAVACSTRAGGARPAASSSRGAAAARRGDGRRCWLTS